MATIKKTISTTATPDAVWSALRDVGELHTRLVPGFVVDTKLEDSARLVTFGNGLVARELIVTLDDNERRVVWSAVGGALTHHNGSAQVVIAPSGETSVVWIADFLPNEAAATMEGMMDQGMAVMKKTLDSL
jgi:carbon monoxide dehydrogenase subunit G